MLVAQIAKDGYSHLHASMRGWGYAPNPMDAFFLDWLDAQAMMHHKSGKVPPKPVARPWETAVKATVPTHNPDREERRKELQERLGLRSVVEANDDPHGNPHAEGDD